MYKGLAGKNAIVTGGASGIGQAITRKLVAEGTNVLIADQNIEQAQQLASELGPHAAAFHVDVRQPNSVQAMVRFCESHFGPLHLAVNSAGISGIRETPIHELDIDAWQRVIDINLHGTFYCLKYELQAMLAQGGAIVNMGSILSQVAVAGSAGYVSSKHALVGLTKTAALDYAKQNIRVNLIGPGYIETPLIATGMSQGFRATLENKHPVQRLGQPEEIAELCLFLLSEQSSFITGALYLADGGYTVL